MENKKIVLKLTKEELNNLLGTVNSQENNINRYLKKDNCSGFRLWKKDMSDLWMKLYDVQKKAEMKA